MIISFLRAILLYGAIIGAIRLMGKRQISELQTSELVVTLLISDIAAIPMQDGCCDAVLDVFTPAHYGEFRRVLKPGGVLLKLAPRAGYLRELRQAASAHLRHAEYDGSQVEHYARAHMHMLDERVITYTIPVEGEIVSHLALMTPMLSGVDVAQLNLSGVRSITVDEVLYIGTL